jgi:hypothetical protein
MRPAGATAEPDTVLVTREEREHQVPRRPPPLREVEHLKIVNVCVLKRNDWSGRGGTVPGDQAVALDLSMDPLALPLVERGAVGRPQRDPATVLVDEIDPLEAERDTLDARDHHVPAVMRPECDRPAKFRGQAIFMPEIARAITRRWISEVPSKIV